jgi:large subunit ribosomal protein L29
MSVEDLESRLTELTEERFRLRFRSATESIENPMRFRAIRRDIARIRTILKEKVASHESPVATEASATS